MKKIQDQLNEFVPISLEHLNATMELLERIDDKYLLSTDQISDILEKMKKHYSILSIKWKSIFLYDNIHFDTEDFQSYKIHLTNRAKRRKARSRMYVDSNLSFFECKIKNNEVTSKYRYNTEPEKHGKVDSESGIFLKEIIKTNLGKELIWEIGPKIITRYNRMTFCGIETQERVTIDMNLEFCIFGQDNWIKLPDLIIIENKYQKDKSKFDKIANDFGLKTSWSCSKYCFGLIYTKMVNNYNKFKKTIQKIEKISPTWFFENPKDKKEITFWLEKKETKNTSKVKKDDIIVSK